MLKKHESNVLLTKKTLKRWILFFASSKNIKNTNQFFLDFQKSGAKQKSGAIFPLRIPYKFFRGKLCPGIFFATDFLLLFCPGFPKSGAKPKIRGKKKNHAGKKQSRPFLEAFWTRLQIKLIKIIQESYGDIRHGVGKLRVHIFQ